MNAEGPRDFASAAAKEVVPGEQACLRILPAQMFREVVYFGSKEFSEWSVLGEK